MSFQLDATVNVLANGPSLSSIDFRGLDGDFIGMNAAYRYWEKVDWFPQHYVCLDAKLIHSHQDWLKNALSKSVFRTAFLHPKARSLKLPDTGTQVTFLDQVRPHIFPWRRVPNSPFFSTANRYAVTTGSWAIRYAASLDYTKIRLAGFDLRYLEKKGAKRLGLTGKTATGEGDVNYFFTGYQTAGDQYNIANPFFYPFDLHKYSALLAIRELKANSPDLSFEFLSGHPELGKVISESEEFRG